MKACFCDLDGPLLDVSSKYYRAYADLVLEQGGQPIVEDHYWELKRQRISPAELLKLSAAPDFARTLFTENWAARVESRDYLKFDRVQPQAREILAQLAARYTLILVTLRRSRDLLLWQLAELGLLDGFVSVLSSGEERTPRWRIKYDLVRAYYQGEPPSGSWFIGDTETDIEAGKQLGACTIGITNGIRSEDFLRRFAPDILVPTIAEIVRTPILS